MHQDNAVCGERDLQVQRFIRCIRLAWLVSDTHYVHQGFHLYAPMQFALCNLVQPRYKCSGIWANIGLLSRRWQFFEGHPEVKAVQKHHDQCIVWSYNYAPDSYISWLCLGKDCVVPLRACFTVVWRAKFKNHQNLSVWRYSFFEAYRRVSQYRFVAKYLIIISNVHSINFYDKAISWRKTAFKLWRLRKGEILTQKC